MSADVVLYDCTAENSKHFKTHAFLSAGPRKSSQGSQHLSHVPPAPHPPSRLAVSTQEEKHSKGGMCDESLKSSGEDIRNAETAAEKQKSKRFSTQLLLALQAKDGFTSGCSFGIKRHFGWFDKQNDSVTT